MWTSRTDKNWGERCEASYPLRCVYGRQRLQLWRGEVDAFPFKFLKDLDHTCEVRTAPERIGPCLWKAELVTHYVTNEKGDCSVMGVVLNIASLQTTKPPLPDISPFQQLTGPGEKNKKAQTVELKVFEKHLKP